MSQDIENAQHTLDAAVAQAPEGSAEAGFAKIPGSKKVRGATPKSAVEPDPEKFAAIGGKFVGKTSDFGQRLMRCHAKSVRRHHVIARNGV
jgi:hypothetical protein